MYQIDEKILELEPFFNGRVYTDRVCSVVAVVDYMYEEVYRQPTRHTCAYQHSELVPSVILDTSTDVTARNHSRANRKHFVHGISVILG